MKTVWKSSHPLAVLRSKVVYLNGVLHKITHTYTETPVNKKWHMMVWQFDSKQFIRGHYNHLNVSAIVTLMSLDRPCYSLFHDCGQVCTQTLDVKLCDHSLFQMVMHLWQAPDQSINVARSNDDIPLRILCLSHVTYPKVMAGGLRITKWYLLSWFTWSNDRAPTVINHIVAYFCQIDALITPLQIHYIHLHRQDTCDWIGFYKWQFAF